MCRFKLLLLGVLAVTLTAIRPTLTPVSEQVSLKAADGLQAPSRKDDKPAQDRNRRPLERSQQPPPAGIVPPAQTPEQDEQRRDRNRPRRDRNRPNLDDFFRLFPTPVPQQPPPQRPDVPPSRTPARPVAPIRPNVPPVPPPPAPSEPPVPTPEHVASLTPSRQRELVRIAQSALEADLDRLTTGDQWREHLRLEELQQIVDCDELQSDLDALQRLLTAFRRTGPEWKHDLADDSGRILRKMAAPPAPRNSKDLDDPHHAARTGALSPADRERLRALVAASPADDGDRGDSLERDLDALKRLAREFSHRVPAASQIPEGDELRHLFPAAPNEALRRADVGVLLRMAARLGDPADDDPRQSGAPSDLQSARDALRRLAARLAEGAVSGDDSCGSEGNAAPRERLREIVERYDRVAAAPGFRQISDLWGFRTLHVALDEYAVAPSQRHRDQLADAAAVYDRELGRLGTGGRWKAFFDLPALAGVDSASTQIARADQDRLFASLNKFERVADDPQYTAITELSGFRVLLIALWQVAADNAIDRVALVPDPQINLPGGTWLANSYTAEFKNQFDWEIRPDAADKTHQFHWGTFVPEAQAVVWQVGRAGFAPFSASEEDIFSHGLVRAGDDHGKSGEFIVDFGRLVADLDLVAAAPPVEEWIPLAALDPQPTILFPVRIELGGPIGLSPAFFNAGGAIIFHVRVIPVAAFGSTVPVGQPSNVIRVYYGTKPDDTDTIRLVGDDEYVPYTPPTTPPSLRVFSFQYEPMKTYCIAHRDKSDCHTYKGEGRSGWSQFFEDVAGAWNFASEFYQDIKSAVVSAVSGALNAALALIDQDLQIPESVLMSALDGALMSVGIPPNIPTLNELLEQNAELLAQKIVEEAGVPGPLVETARDKVKSGLIAGARSAQNALIRNDGEGTPCERKTDYPYFLVGFENIGPSTCTDIRLNILGDSFECPFATGALAIPSLGPGERVVLPMHMRRSQHDRFWDAAFYDDSAWYQAYATDVFDIAIIAIQYYTTEPREFHSSEPLYGSPKRVWNTPYAETR